jgi:cytochrome c biogenesis protein CcmG/thiol:disulfide interchange protein DsbE
MSKNNLKNQNSSIKMKKFLLSVALVTLFSTWAYSQNLGEITLKDINGNNVSLSKYTNSGKIVIFSFWATWCSPCKKELSNISELYEDWKSDYNIEVVAINIDDSRNQAKVKPYIDGQGWEFPVLLDPNEQLKRTLNFQTVPYTFVLGKDGKVIYQHSGYVEGDEYELEDKLEKWTSK